MKEREITALEEGLGYHFRRRAMIEQAVTHSSQAREIEEAVGASAARAVLSYLEAGRSREEAGTTEAGTGEGGRARSA